MPGISQLEAPVDVTIYRKPAKAAVMGYKTSQYCISQQGSSHLATGHLFPVICVLRGQQCPLAAAQPTDTACPNDNPGLTVPEGPSIEC